MTREGVNLVKRLHAQTQAWAPLAETLSASAGQRQLQELLQHMLESRKS